MNKKLISAITFLLILICTVQSGFAQIDKLVLNGIVLNTNNNPLEGATIKEVGANNISITNNKGEFQITVSKKSGRVEISNIGYKTRITNYTVGQNLRIALEEDSKSLGEVVVVGYGTQKKENLTGAVDQISADDFQNRPITNLSQGLQGMIPNLNLDPTDGRPTQSPNYNIRGVTSIGQGGSALILIDGVEGNPALLNPHDIATVTVLKDAASASIYGARAAFGVVLITTKDPNKNKSQISYQANYSVKTPLNIPDFISDGYQWASMFNEAFSSWNNYASTPQNVNKTMRFSQAYLEELKRRTEDPSLPKVEIDPITGEYVYYDSHDWMKDLYKPNSWSLDQNLNISGKSEKAGYMLSARYHDQPGLFRYNSDDYKMYNIRAKGSVEVFPWLSVNNNTEFSKMIYHTPLNIGEDGGIWRNIVAEGHPMAPLFNPDGTLTYSAAYTVGDYWYGRNGMDYNRDVLKTTSGFKSSFFNNEFHIKGDLTYQVSNNNETRIRVPVPYSRKPGVIEYLGNQYNDLREINRNTQYLASNIYGEYEKVIKNDHSLKVLLGYNYELSTYKRFGAERNGLIYADATDLNLALGESIVATGGYEQWNVLGGFYRLNYNYQGRYLLEVNGRYDGSSKFPTDQRFAFFPSVSAGWRVSKENFWKVNPAIISNLKFRASYGSLGNGNISSYVFQEQLALNRMTRILEGTQPAYTRNPGVIPDGLTWETSNTVNYGLDAAFINNKLLLNFDYYVRNTTNMFTAGKELPAVFGAGSPRGNYADLKTEGFELSLNYNDQFSLFDKPFSYSIRGVLSDNTSKITKFNNARKLLNDYYEGQTLGEIWGYVTDGYFVSEHDVRTSADQSLFNNTAQGVWRSGDIKFKDLNNDGVINNGENTFNNPGDRVVIGNSNPRYRFGLNLSGEWQRFFVSAFFQGVGKQSWYPGRGENSFWGQYNAPYGHPLKSQLGNIWTEENTDAYFPRYTGYIAFTGGGTLRETQTRYLQNIGYVRLKNFQIGYQLPSQLLNKVGASSASFYVSGENLWTYSPMYKISKNIDVENTGASDQTLANTNYGNGLNYPLLKSYSVGISLTF
ncbi:MAG: TonB-dependent receptor [Ginsengibacter sp.]